MNRFAALAVGVVAAAGIAFTPAPAAAADGKDIAKIIAGIAVVGIIAKAIDDRKDRKEASRAATGTDFGRLGSGDDRRRTIDGTIRPYHRDQDRHGPKPGRGYKQLALPEQCLVTVETGRGDRLAYGARCLDRRYKFASKLPQSCETVVRTPRGFRTVYGARCLARDGWRVAGR
ncbi:hypothetical protein [Silicimonas sp. MF1-12-2]|uniref:hypothetical protein n=1 Tax=Silicimonas sp. MF1-12-2 TaxID=3384793 RepID=UPI0039B49ACB